MQAGACVVAEADGRGGTRLTRLYGEPPVLPRRTLGDGAGVTVHLVGGAAGPLGGDQLSIDVIVGPDADLTIHTVAATVALPGPGRSATSVTVRVAAGGRLAWLPEPLVAATGCDHVARATIELAEGARLVWRDELVTGRHGEPAGDLLVGLAVSLAGRPLLRQDLAIGPRATGFDGPAILGRARATGSLLIVDPQWTVEGKPAGRTVEGGAVMPLAGPAMLATAVAPDAHTLRRTLIGLTS